MTTKPTFITLTEVQSTHTPTGVFKGWERTPVTINVDALLSYKPSTYGMLGTSEKWVACAEVEYKGNGGYGSHRIRTVELPAEIKEKLLCLGATVQ